MAQLTGKEAGLFMPSGTCSNQIALRTHLTQPPYSILCDHRSHINKYVKSVLDSVHSWQLELHFVGMNPAALHSIQELP